MNKLLEFMSKAKVLWPLILLLWTSTVFALDSRYLTRTGYAAGVVQQLQREIATLEYKILYVKGEEKRMLKGLIIIKEQQIKEVK